MTHAQTGDGRELETVQSVAGAEGHPRWPSRSAVHSRLPESVARATGHHRIEVSMVPAPDRSDEQSREAVLRAVARGQVVARLAEADGGAYRVYATVIEDPEGTATVVFHSRASPCWSRYIATDVPSALADVRAVLASHGAYNW